MMFAILHRPIGKIVAIKIPMRIALSAPPTPARHAEIVNRKAAPYMKHRPGVEYAIGTQLIDTNHRTVRGLFYLRDETGWTTADGKLPVPAGTKLDIIFSSGRIMRGFTVVVSPDWRGCKPDWSATFPDARPAYWRLAVKA
jgi:hypothetical protein